MSRRVIAKECRNGDCPQFVLDEPTGDVIVTGYDLDDPTREIDVRIPGPTWAVLIAQLPR